MTTDLSPAPSNKSESDGAIASTSSDRPSLVVEVLPEMLGRLLVESIGLLPFPANVALALLLLVAFLLVVGEGTGTGEQPSAQ